MSYYLFDNPKMGILIALIAEFLLVMTWAILQGRFRKLLLLIGPVLAGAFILLDVLVHTDREALEEATRQVVQAAEEEDAASIIALISDKFLHEASITRDVINQQIQQRFPDDKDIIDSNRVTKLEVTEVKESGGKVEFTVLTTMGLQSKYAHILQKSRWRFHFTRDPDGQFRINNIEMTYPQELNFRRLINMAL
jgi:hypothetical protein